MLGTRPSCRPTNRAQCLCAYLVMSECNLTIRYRFLFFKFLMHRTDAQSNIMPLRQSVAIHNFPAIHTKTADDQLFFQRLTNHTEAQPKLVSNSILLYTQRLRCCATNRKVAGSIPAGVSGFFIDIKYF